MAGFLFVSPQEKHPEMVVVFVCFLRRHRHATPVLDVQTMNSQRVIFAMLKFGYLKLITFPLGFTSLLSISPVKFACHYIS